MTRAMVGAKVAARRQVEITLTLGAADAAQLRATLDEARAVVAGRDPGLYGLYADLSMAITEALEAEGVVVVAPRAVGLAPAPAIVGMSGVGPVMAIPAGPAPASQPSAVLPDVEPVGEGRPLGTRFVVYDEPAAQIRPPEEIVKTKNVDYESNARPEPTRGLVPKFK